MVIKVLNLDKCLKKFGDLRNIDLMPEITLGARKIQVTAKDLAPVDTGMLRRSIKRKLYPDKNAAIVYTTVEYAPYQEFGTTRMRAHPFLRPAFNIHKEEIKRSVRQAVEKRLKRK